MYTQFSFLTILLYLLISTYVFVCIYPFSRCCSSVVCICACMTPKHAYLICVISISLTSTILCLESYLFAWSRVKCARAWLRVNLFVPEYRRCRYSKGAMNWDMINLMGNSLWNSDSCIPLKRLYSFLYAWVKYWNSFLNFFLLKKPSQFIRKCTYQITAEAHH
jgi:hypothetical protein